MDSLFIYILVPKNQLYHEKREYYQKITNVINQNANLRRYTSINIYTDEFIESENGGLLREFDICDNTITSGKLISLKLLNFGSTQKDVIKDKIKKNPNSFHYFFNNETNRNVRNFDYLSNYVKGFDIFNVFDY